MKNHTQDETGFMCPYCGSAQTILADPTGGRDQSLTVDCETCCRPILITLSIHEEGEVTIQVERE